MAPRGTADVERVARPRSGRVRLRGVGTFPEPWRRTWPVEAAGTVDAVRPAPTSPLDGAWRRPRASTGQGSERRSAQRARFALGRPRRLEALGRGGLARSSLPARGEKPFPGILGDLRGRNGSRWALWAAGRSAVQAPRGRTGVVSGPSTGAAASTGTRREGRVVALPSPATDFRRSTARTPTLRNVN